MRVVATWMALVALAVMLTACSDDSPNSTNNNLDDAGSGADVHQADGSTDEDAGPTPDAADAAPDDVGRDTAADARQDTTRGDTGTVRDAADDTSTGGGSDIWISAYLASWKHYAPPGGNWGNLPTDAIDWDAFTHLIYFAMHVNSDGTMRAIEQYQNMNPDRVHTIVAAAHDHNKPIIISIGGAGNHDQFAAAISPAVRTTFINNIVDLMTTWGFDGIDVDMEPIRSGDQADFKAFIQELHAALQAETTPLRSRPLLTVATGRQADLFAELEGYFDQINMMTYDMSGAWQGWVTWHNSPLSNGGYRFESTGELVPSIEREVDRFLSAGVPREKLGVGIDFYGYVWSGGVWEPRQSWSTPPEVTDNVPYHDLVADYDFSAYYQWDADAHAPYLSVQDQTPKQFVSFDDERAIADKIDYVRSEGLGGAILWELGGGYVADAPAGQRDPLLQAVKSAANAN